jgi:hypothetical protein
MNDLGACLRYEVLCPCRSYAQLALEHKKITMDKSVKSVWDPNNEKHMKHWEAFFESYCYADVGNEYAVKVRATQWLYDCVMI